jgi:hypothetical protein
MDEEIEKGRPIIRRRVVSLEDATAELMEAEPGTAIALTPTEAEQLDRIQARGARRFNRSPGTLGRPAGRA